MLHQINAPQFYTDLGLQKQCWILLQMVKFKDFSRPLSVFQVLFKANFIFEDFSSQSCIFKNFSSMREPWRADAYCCEEQERDISTP